MSIDEIDLRILDMLQRNGKLSQARIAGAVGLTTPSVNERIKKMERHGMIRGFVALLDHEKMGLPLTAYVDVALEHPRFEKGFVDDLEKLSSVQECHYLAGEFAYRIKVKAADPASARRLPPAAHPRDQGRDAHPGAGLAVLEEGIDAAAADPREARGEGAKNRSRFVPRPGIARPRPARLEFRHHSRIRVHEVPAGVREHVVVREAQDDAEVLGDAELSVQPGVPAEHLLVRVLRSRELGRHRLRD